MDYLWRGIRDFYIHRFLWRYMAVPLAAALLADLAIGLAAFYWWQPWLEEHWAAWLENSRLLRGGYQVFEYVTVRIFNIAPAKLGRTVFWLAVSYGMSLVNLTVFSLAGGCFFSAMTEMYELRVLKRPRQTGLNRRRKILLQADAVWYALNLSLLLIVLGAAMMILPVVGFLAAALLGGYCYTLFFMSGAGARRGWSVHRMNFCFAGRRDLLYGFGMAAFCLMQLPFVAVFLLPGFYLGGTLLVEYEI